MNRIEEISNGTKATNLLSLDLNEFRNENERRENVRTYDAYAERKREVVINECYNGCGDDEVANLVDATGMKFMITCERNIGTKIRISERITESKNRMMTKGK